MIQGSLYLVPVPIGNLKDITLRAIDVLNQVDVILAEDTRISGMLLSEYNIKTQLLSYHQHNEKSRVKQILKILESGKNIALISDAGTPLISDPGSIIVQELLEENFDVVSLPGANAALTCLPASGLSTDIFTFFGFLPSSGKARSEKLVQLAKVDHTVILYEAPHRVLKTLQDLFDLGMKDRKIVLGRELTKTYESYLRATVENALKHYSEEKPRGEFVIVIEGKAEFLRKNSQAKLEYEEELKQKAYKDLKKLIEGGMTTKSAASFLAEKYPINKNELYQKILEIHEK